MVKTRLQTDPGRYSGLAGGVTTIAKEVSRMLRTELRQFSSRATPPYISLLVNFIDYFTKSLEVGLTLVPLQRCYVVHM